MSKKNCKQKKQKDNFFSEILSNLYVHVPYCLKKCRYCDFYSVPISGNESDKYVRATEKELTHFIGMNGSFATIFIGGGTPTVLGLDDLAGLLGIFKPLLREDGEFTVEANPATIDSEIATIMRNSGVNRVSLGGQSFDSAELKLLGRVHTPNDISAAMEIVRSRGITDINIDLIYGIPGQTLSSWARSLDEVLALEPTHISCYCLSIEKGTEIFDDISSGKLTIIDGEACRRMYYHAIETIEQAGLEHYEISNFARPGRRCMHNIQYWKNGEYLGLGPAAASYIAGERRTNLPNLHGYLSSVFSGQAPPCESERLSGRDVQAETLMLALRMTQGVSREEFFNRFGCDCLDAFAEAFSKYIAIGAICVTERTVRITRDFLFTADSILAEIIAEA